MTRRYLHGFVPFLALMLLHGCTTTPSSPHPGAAAPRIAAPPDPEPRTDNPGPSAAAASLVAEAESLYRKGRLDPAAAKIERALRIEPDNAGHWHRLAVIRLAQGQAAQAQTLARKSNALAPGDEALKRMNWRLIAEARREQGDQAGYEDAMRRSGDVQGP